MKSKLYGYYSGDGLYGLPSLSTRPTYSSVYASNNVDKYKIYPTEVGFVEKSFKGVFINSIEVCTYLTYLINGSPLHIESLFVPDDKVHFISCEFKTLILDNRNLLIDRGQMVDNIVWNAEYLKKISAQDNEREITRGDGSYMDVERDILKSVGHLRKDYSRLIRVLASALHFLKTDAYPLTNLKEVNGAVFELCVALELGASFRREDLDATVDAYVKDIEKFCLDGDEEKFRFDSSVALGALKEFDRITKNR